MHEGRSLPSPPVDPRLDVFPPINNVCDSVDMYLKCARTYRHHRVYILLLFNVNLTPVLVLGGVANIDTISSDI